jgi:signal transduction histidine kinase
MTVRLKIALTIFFTGALTALGVIVTVLLAFDRFEHETTYYRANGFLDRVLMTHDDIYELQQRNPQAFQGFLHNLVLFEPDTRLYLLDRDGTVLGSSHDLKLPPGFKVALGPVMEAAGDKAMPYVMGEDPERLGGQAVIAAVPVRRSLIRSGDAVAGYLYLVAHKRTLGEGRLAALRSTFALPAVALVAAVVALSTLLTAWVVAGVMRPLRELTAAVAAVSRDGLQAPDEAGAGALQASPASPASPSTTSTTSTAFAGSAAFAGSTTSRASKRPPGSTASMTATAFTTPTTPPASAGSAPHPDATWLPARASRDEFGQLAQGFGAMLAALRKQWDTLRRLDHFRREGVSNLSHDLRSPLTATAACLETLGNRWAGKPDRQADRDLLEVALRNTRNAARLVQSLGDLARLDEPSFALQRVDMNLAELLDDIALRFAEPGQRAGVRVEAVAPAGGAALPWAAVDVELFERAVANLVDNALKFCRPGDGIRLQARVVHGVQGVRGAHVVQGVQAAQLTQLAQEAQVARATPDGKDAGNAQPAQGGTMVQGDVAAAAAALVEVTVRDTGPGVPPDDLPHLFDRFFQARRSVAPATGEGGKGLGLAIVKRIAELHGGSVAIVSELGAGTCVTLRLPAVVQADARR